MKMDNQLVIKRVLPIILKAQKADDNDLKLLRSELIGVLDEIGPKRFVTMTAEILEKNFQVEGCNDVRIPLKRLFSVSVEEAETAMLQKDYGLPEDHPISVLLREHILNIDRLKKLDSTLEKVRRGIFSESVLTQLKEITVYFSELDSHIRKEEEVLFPVLKERGMKEHPDTLKEEHKRFKEILTEMIEVIDKLNARQFLVPHMKIAKLGGEFVPAMSNHIFRETYILYPAALEFIKGEREWNKIKKGFNGIE